MFFDRSSNIRFLLTLYLLCLPSLITGSQRSSSSKVNTFDSKDVVPFSFPLSVYTATVLPDVGPNYYISANEPRLGVPEPFNGRPSGTVQFSILGHPEYKDFFHTETVKLGGFYFLRLRTTHNADFNSKKLSVYSFDVQALFQSRKINKRPPITLSNKTHITIRLIDRNDNCPLFSQDAFQLTVYENATLFSKVGTVSATDADAGINGQIYYFLQPERIMVPFRIDPRSGDIFPTKSLVLKRNHGTSLEQITYISKFEGLEEYSFEVFARHRGNLSHVSCEFVSHARVQVRVLPVRSDKPQINAELHTKISRPGEAGTIYATVTVATFGDPLNIHLSILEPQAAALFELVRIGNQAKWILRLRFQYPLLSLNSRIGVTLEAVDIEFTSIRDIPSTSRHFLDVLLLPRPSFQIKLPQKIRISVSEVALVNSTVYIINPHLDFYVHNSSFLFRSSEKDENLPISITETGAVVVTKPIDLETLGFSRIEIPFTVVDRNNILLSSMADSKLIVDIIDYNELDPVISNSGAEKSVPESLPVGSEVLQIEAYDPDFSSTRLFFTLYDEEKLPFNFSTSKSGSLLLKTPLDAETMPAEFHVKVKVADSGRPFPRSVVVIYIIHILDVNEFSPVFVEKFCDAQLAVTHHGQIQTMAPSGLELGRFFAEDLDRDGGSAVRINVASTTVSRPCFKIDPDTGRLVLICSNVGLPDTTVSVYLEATDGKRTSEEPFELRINLEKVGYGSVYSKSCQPSGIYERMQEQKQKRTDYEYLLTGLTSIDSFFKKHDEVITPTLNIPSVLKIPENLPIGTPILYFAAKFLEPPKGVRIPQLIYGIEAQETVLSTNDTVSPPYQAFRLRGGSLSDVSVDNEMVLEVAAPIDRESFSSYLVSIRVCVLQDSIGPCALSSLNVLVEDLLDSPPRFVINEAKAGTHTFSVSENEAEGSVIGQVVAMVDDTESKLRFSLGNYKDYFKIHHRTGRLSLKKKLDRELLDSYLLTVKATNMLSPPVLGSSSELRALALKATPAWALERTTTTYVRVNVLDINDNSPEFLASYDDLVVPADIPNGAYVTTLLAKDADDGNNAVLQYSLFGSEAEKACFDCDLATGVVRISADCEGLKAGAFYSLTAWVRDLGAHDPRQTSTQFKVTVLGLSVNAYPPRFDAPYGLYQGRIREGSPIGSQVVEIVGGKPLQIGATDPEGLPIIYRTVGGSGLGTFTVTSEGTIVSTRELDMEGAPFSGGYWLQIYAEEDHSSSAEAIATDGIPPRYAMAEVFIRIEDENDNRPMPAAPEFHFRVTEGTPPQSIVATITGKDGDATGHQLHHAIVRGDPDGYFIINPSTGQIATSAAHEIDRESSFLDAQGLPTDRVHLVIALMDSGEPKQVTEVHATALIDDLNDNTPQFLFTRPDCGAEEAECYRFVHHLIPGDAEVGASTCMGRVFAVDLDRGANGSVTYELAQSDSFFSIKSVTGEVCLTGTPLTAAAASEHVIWVTARDHGIPPRFTAQPIGVHINVLPPIKQSEILTEGSLKFDSTPPEKLTVNRRLPPGTVLYHVELVFSNVNWTFSLADSKHPTPFDITPLSGQKAVVFLREWLNSTYDDSQRDLEVKVAFGSLKTSKKTSIKIEALERDPPFFNASSITAGKRVKLSVTDFRKGNEEASETGASGVEVRLAVLESALVGDLVCSLADQTSPPVGHFAIVAAGNTASLAHFSLAKETGELTITQPLDYESQREHSLVVGIFYPDDADARKSYITLVVEVVGVNEFPPIFLPLQPFVATVDTPVGATVGRISAYDLDSLGEIESSITYSITPVGDAELFSIDSELGELRLSKPLSSTQKPSQVHWPPVFKLNVAATDRGGKVNYTTVTVLLNPGPGALPTPLPRFQRPTFISKVLENSPPGFVVGALRDFLVSRPAAPVKFELLNHNDKFAVSASSGLLASLTSLDRETQDLYRLRVQVSGMDGLPAKLPDATEIEVHVIDVNDNDPRLDSLFIEGVLNLEGEVKKTPVFDAFSRKPLRIRPIDLDEGPSGDLSFRFVGPGAEHYSTLYEVDPSTGVLVRLPRSSLESKMIVEERESLLTIEVSDNGSPLARTAGALLRVRVRLDGASANAPPYFLQSENPLVASVFLPTYTGAEIARFTAVDPDFNDSVTYAIGESDSGGFFAIDSSTGVLRVSSQLAAATSLNQRQFLLQIEAKDGRSPRGAAHNVSVFIHSPDPAKKRLQIDPAGGLNVSLIEHFADPAGPKLLGQLHVRKALPNEVFTFELANVSLRAFSIDRYTGAVYATGDASASPELDREVTPVLQLKVVVRDWVLTSLGLSQQRYGEANVNVHLEDINDHVPVFDGMPYHATFCVKEPTQLAEDSKLADLATKPPSHILSQLHQACQSNYFKIEAKDSDAGRNGNVSYQIQTTQPHSEPPLLSIDPMSGRLSLIRAVPADWSGRRLIARVRATDGGGLYADSEAVAVQLAARQGPRFTSTYYAAAVPENAPLGESVTSVMAISASGTTLLYSIVSLGPDFTESSIRESPFSLDYETGVIRIGAPLDYEKTNYYNLLVEALDTTTGNTAHVNVYINVTDVNDERPAFATPFYKAVISEAAEINSIVSLDPTHLANDLDSGVNGQLRYYLQSLANDANVIEQYNFVPGLKINPVSGVIQLTQKLDFEKQPSLNFWIVAVDGGSPPLTGRSLVELSVMDANDNPPRFDAEPGVERGPENDVVCHREVTVAIDTPTDAFVLRLSASDPDVNDTLTYRLLDSSVDVFRINTTTGAVHWRPPLTTEAEAKLDTALLVHENGGVSELSFEVEVSDGLHTAACWIEVSVAGGNRFAPSFLAESDAVAVHVAEDARVGSRLALLAASDADPGRFGRLTYRLLLPSLEQNSPPFALDPMTGELTLTGPLDREQADYYSFTVMATDAGGLSAFMRLEINVTDVNDNAPVIEQTSYEVTLTPSLYTKDAWVTFSSTNRVQPEGLGLPVRIQAHDADDTGGNSHVVFRLLSPSSSWKNTPMDALPFTVNAQTGELLLTRPLPPSREDFGFFVEACDQPEESRPLCSEPVGVTVHLAPQEPSWMPNISCSSLPVPEVGHDLGEPVSGCQVSSEAADRGGVWSLIGAASSLKFFTIDAATASVHLTSDLDFEGQASHDLIVQYRIQAAGDGVPTPLVAFTRVTIQVEDVNDCIPTFQTNPDSRVSIPENIPPGSRIFQMLATDCDLIDKNLVSYSIRRKAGFVSDTSILPFSIGSDGWVFVTGSIDRETTESYELAVTATDSARHASVAYLAVDILDLNDNPPEWKLEGKFVDFDTPSAEVNVTEGLTSAAIFKFEVTDKDISSDLTLRRFYQVGETSKEFTVSPDGHVFVREPLDAESKSIHELKVNAFDGLHETVLPFTLRVRVMDLNDNSPICHVPDRTAEVLESAPNGFVIFQLNATDADTLPENSALTYHLVENQNEADAFKVDPETGEISLAWELDYETKKSYSFRVEVKDRATHACFYNLQVRVLDVNDNPPVFKQPIKITPVPENAPVGSLIGKVHAMDADSVDVNGLEYGIASPRNSSFSVNRHSGILRVVQPLDRESLALHRFVVLVTDGAAGKSISTSGGGTVHSATASVEVLLVDINDSPPQFTEPRPTASVSENSTVGTVVMQLNAISLDEGDNAVIRYRLLESNAPEFAINATTGELYLKNVLDYERTPRYFLTIEARDGGAVPLSTTTVATVNVIDINDNPPYFIGQDVPSNGGGVGECADTASTAEPAIGVFTFEVYENSPIGTQIGRISAGDLDSGDNGRLSFTLCDPTRLPEVVLGSSIQTGVAGASSTSPVGRLFEVGEARGELSLLFSPDREEAALFIFEICVADHGEPSRSAVTKVSVAIRDTNDCQPQFERPNYEFYVQVDRNGNIVSTNLLGNLENISRSKDEEVLLGHVAVRDLDSMPNAGPFKCKLTGFVASPSAAWDTSTPLFSVQSLPTATENMSDLALALPSDPVFFQGLETNQTGFCSLYAAPTLPLGSKSLVVRAHDSGMTALHSSVTISVHVSLQSNLPPEIVSSNTTLVVFRDSSGGSVLSSAKNRFDIDSPATSTKLPKPQDMALLQVSVRDRTVYDQLLFEMLPEPSSSQFVIDQYDGSIYVKSTTFGAMEYMGSSSAGAAKDLSLNWLKPTLPRLSPVAQLNSGDYRLRVKVTNGSLSSNNTVYLKVLTVTEEMLESACVLHVADLSPNELFLLHLDNAIQRELAQGLLRPFSGGTGDSSSLSDNVYIISVQAAAPVLRRQKRLTASTASTSGSGSDLLIAVYDPRDRHYIDSNHLVQRIHALQSNISKTVGRQIHAYNNLCAQKKCESGSCVTDVVLEPPSGVGSSVLQVHGANRQSPRFSLVVRCRCSASGGGGCERARDACSAATCPAPRICVPSPLTPATVHICLCPLPWTGPNCDRLARPQIPTESASSSSPTPDSCFSEVCFLQREKGSLQFTGGSFAHWQIGNPNEHRVEIAFSIRTRQHSGPLFSVNWSALRAFRIRLINNGNLAVSVVNFTSGIPTSDWLISGQPQISDGQWHRVRFALFAGTTDYTDMHWWAELTIDGVHVYSSVVDWAPGDAERQEVLLGAELVHGFRPLAEIFYPRGWLAKEPNGAQDPKWPQFAFSHPPPILRSGFIGCIKDLYIDRVKPPYQPGLSQQQVVLSALKNRKPLVGVAGDTEHEVIGLPVLQLIRTRNLQYQCSAQATYDSSCAYAPCRNGGSCVSRRALAFAYLDKGPTAVRPSDFNCSCQEGFEGTLCEEGTNICLLQPCFNGGSCESVSDKSASYRCICPPGFSGVHCDQRLTPSGPSALNATNSCTQAEALLATSRLRSPSSAVCLQGAACVDSGGGPTCLCPLGWRGGRCEQDIDECRLASTAYMAAENGDGGAFDFVEATDDPLCNPYGSRRGFCVNLPGSYRCNCSLGYTGRNCQIRNLTPIKPDSNALGLTPMHGYLIAGIFALVFLLAVATVVVLTCCFRRRSTVSNGFYGARNGGQSNSSFFPDKMMAAGLLQSQNSQQQVKLLESARMLPEGGDGSVTYSPNRTGLGGSVILGPGRQVFTPDFRRQSSYFVDENGRPITMRPSSVVGSNAVHGEPIPFVYLAGGTSGTVSPGPTVGYMPATTALARRSFVECAGPHRMTPQHLSSMHLGPSVHGTPLVTQLHHVQQNHQQPQQQQRPGSSNTMTSDRISLGSGSDQFSVQSGGPRQGPLQPQSMPQPVFYVYPQSVACTRRSQVFQPQQVMSSEGLTPIFYRQSSGNSGSNLSVTGRRVSVIGAPNNGGGVRLVSPTPNGQLVPLQVIANAAPIRGATSLHQLQGVRPRPISPPTVATQPYWAESTLSLLPPVQPSSRAATSTQNRVGNSRTSLYRRAGTQSSSPKRVSRQRNSLVIDGASQENKDLVHRRSLSVCAPLISSDIGESCPNPVEEFESVHWDKQTGSAVSSAFVIAEPRGLQKFPTLKKPEAQQASTSVAASRGDSLCSSEATLAAPLLQDSPFQPPASQAPTGGTLKSSSKPHSRSGSMNGDGGEAVAKANGFAPRPLPPNMHKGNDNDASKNGIGPDDGSTRKPLLSSSSSEAPLGTLKKQK